MNRRQFLHAGATLAAPLALGAAESRPPRVIDIHCHAGRGLNFEADDPHAPPWTTYNDPDRVLRQADAAGIDRSVIFPISNVTYREANEEIAGYVRRHPHRLIGFAKHDPKTEAGSIRALLVREVRELGLKGVKLHAVPTPEVLDAALELRIPILMHTPRVEDGLRAVEDHPRLNFILAHLGSFASRDWREHLRAIEAARRFPNLHLDTSGVVFFPYLEQAAHEVPAEQLVFGSDAPLVDARVELYKLRLLKLPPEHEARVLGGNARRLLDLDP